VAVYGLVHGAWAGAWVWDLVTPHLEDAGHEVVAVDLPCEDPNATFSDYAEIVTHALNGRGDDVVLVGHSTGGFTIPIVAARRPVREFVFVCGVIPVPGKSAVEVGLDFHGSDPAEWQIVNDDNSISLRPEAIAPYVAQDVDPVVVAEYAPRFRKQCLAPFAEPCPLESLPDLDYRYILCQEDRIVSPKWSRRIVPKRLGVEPIELPGSHSPMGSRPEDLTAAFLT
jgi:pimeloyl-ACP methyl ester carboxylesterase